MSSSISRRFHRKSFCGNRTIPTSSTSWLVDTASKLPRKAPMESTWLRSRRTTGRSALVHISMQLQPKTHNHGSPRIRDYRCFAHLRASCRACLAAPRTPSRSSPSHTSTAVCTPTTPSSSAPAPQSPWSNLWKKTPHPSSTRPLHRLSATASTQLVASTAAYS